MLKVFLRVRVWYRYGYYKGMLPGSEEHPQSSARPQALPSKWSLNWHNHSLSLWRLPLEKYFLLHSPSPQLTLLLVFGRSPPSHSGNIHLLSLKRSSREKSDQHTTADRHPFPKANGKAGTQQRRYFIPELIHWLTPIFRLIHRNLQKLTSLAMGWKYK